MEIKDLRAAPKNPRVISAEKLDMLKRALHEFGDLGGFVFNRKTKRLVGGHQRAKAFDKSAKVVVERKYSKPSRTGTVAEGYVLLDGERFSYREVLWDEQREKAANLAANKGAGDWDEPLVRDVLRELSDFGFDVSLAMFDDIDFARAVAEPKTPKPKESKAGAEAEDADEPKSKKRVVCPECNHRFTPGWS